MLTIINMMHMLSIVNTTGMLTNANILPRLNGMSGRRLWPVLLHADDAPVFPPPFAGLVVERAVKFKATIIAPRVPLIRLFISHASREA